VGEDPSLIQFITTKMLLVHVDKIHRILENPTIPLAQRLAAVEMLAKLAQQGAYSKAQQVNSGPSTPTFSVNIIMEPNAKRPTITVDAEQAKPSLSVESQATDVTVKEVTNGSD
jgi:hypothetical protein